MCTIQVNTFKKIFWLDDRTNIPSTTKLIRWMTWVISVLSIINLQVVIYFHSVEITTDDVNMLSIVERLIMAILALTESSYQFNRSQKIKFGSASLVESEENEDQKEPKRIEI